MDASTWRELVEHSRMLKVILIVLALPLLVFGAWRLFDPIGFAAFNGSELPTEAGLLSDVRAAGGAVALSGVIVLLGAFRPQWSFVSIVLAAVIFVSFGAARLLGIVLDGLPPRGVIQGMVTELVFGALAVFAYVRYRRRDR
jgi:hypothetical protein